MNKCIRCGTEFEGKFCPECGARANCMYECPRCGNELKEGMKFCPNCGYNLCRQQSQSTKMQFFPAVIFGLWAALLWTFYASSVVKGDGLLIESFNLYQMLIYRMAGNMYGAICALLALAAIADVYAVVLVCLYSKHSRNSKKVSYVSFIFYGAIIICAGILVGKSKEMLKEGFDEYHGDLPAVVIALTAVFAFFQILATVSLKKNTSQQTDIPQPDQPRRLTLTLGSYPQSIVIDHTLKYNLNIQLNNRLPSSDNANGWTDYGYYINGKVQSFMWYIDVNYQGAKYRGVYFTYRRPYYATGDGSGASNKTYDNGYDADTVYWFKWEPITWRVLKQENDKALIMADMIIDSQHYYYKNGGVRIINGKNVYPNNYFHSDIRAWLIDTFYNAAFDELNKKRIVVTEVDNSASSTDNEGNGYACENSHDAIFLLSYKDATNTDYGFDRNADCDVNRRLKVSDYAQCQGAFTSSASNKKESGWWWLRSPNAKCSNGADVAGESYIVHDDDPCANVDYTGYGVAPALQILLWEK